MKRVFFLFVAATSIAFFVATEISAQFPKIKIPKITQPKSEPTPKEQAPTGEAPTSRPPAETNPGAKSRGSDQPTIAKDSLQVTAFTYNVYKKNFNVWSWVPKMNFRVNGPISSGSQLYAEFSLPGTGPWVKFDCDTGQVESGRWWKTECGARDIPEEKSVTYTGPVNFVIRMRNELLGTDTALFSGRIKVGKVHSGEVGPRSANRFVFFVDQDWNLPIAYLFGYAKDWGEEFPMLNVAFWLRGDAIKLDPHLFYQGKEIGKIFSDGIEVGKHGCNSEIENLPTISPADTVPQKAKWIRVSCAFNNVRLWDKRDDKTYAFGQPHLLKSNPGEYEVKLLRNNRLARSLKFTVAPGGKFENGIATSNRLGSDRVIVPIQIIGDQDGQWDRNAWKTDAFYGNPLTGFTALP